MGQVPLFLLKEGAPPLDRIGMLGHNHQLLVAEALGCLSEHVDEVGVEVEVGLY